MVKKVIEGFDGRRHGDAEELEPPLQAQPRQDEDRRHPRARRGRAEPLLRDHEKGLSTGEKQMFVKAKKILATELMYAKNMDEEEAADWLDGVLVDSGPGGAKTARRRSRPPRSRRAATATEACGA